MVYWSGIPKPAQTKKTPYKPKTSAYINILFLAEIEKAVPPVIGPLPSRQLDYN